MPIVPILCGVLLIAGIVALVLSAATWRWYHITLGALIMLLALGWFYLAARTLQTQTVWRNEIAKYETALDTESKTHDKLINGGPDADGKEHPSMNQLQTDLNKMLQGRGRIWGGGRETKPEDKNQPEVWPEVARKAFDPATGKITAVVAKPDPSGIEKNMVLYVFDDTTDPGGQFLGEFEVTAVNGQEIQLTPALKLRTSELQRFAARRNDPLVLYEVMPTDSHEIVDLVQAIYKFTGQQPPDSATIFGKMLFPAGVPDAVKQEYIKDGQPPQAGEKQLDRIWQRVKALKEFDVVIGKGANKQIQHVAADTELELDPQSAKQHIAAGDVALVPENSQVYVRPLNDYVRLYRNLNLEIESLLRTTAEVDSENAAIQDSQQKINKDIEYRTAEIAALQRDLSRFQAETAMIKKHVDALEKQVALVNDQVTQAAEENRKMEAELSQYQHQAATEINRRIQSAMQASDKTPLPAGK